MGQAVSRIFALIPAAGKSVRMGRPKLALPLGDRTVLEWVLAALRQADITDVLVVLGPHVSFLQGVAAKAGAHTLVLPRETPDMRATVLAGLGELQRCFAPTERDCWLLIPADHPTLEPTTVRILMDARDKHPDHSIFLPCHEGKRGHPALIAWPHAAALATLAEGQGINQYLRQHLDKTIEVEVASPQVLIDLDTPEDYERLHHLIRVDQV